MAYLKDYLYPTTNIAYEYKNAASGVLTRKTTITAGIAEPGCYIVPGSTPITREDVFWDGSAWTVNLNWWYICLSNDKVEGVCDHWGYSAHYPSKHISSSYDQTGNWHTDLPICVFVWNGTSLVRHPDGRLWGKVRLANSYGSWGGWTDVVEIDFVHGTCWYDEPYVKSCTNNPPGYENFVPYKTLWKKDWYAKDVGCIYGRTLFYERFCGGYVTGGNAWDEKLHTMYGI
jgi:hypothetical protein